MRRLVSIAALALLGAAFIVSTAFAAPVNIVDPLSAKGNLKTEEQYPDRDWVLLAPKVFQTRFVYGADGSSNGWGTTNRAVTIDSTLAVQTRGFRQVALLFQFTIDDTAQVALFAFQVRGHSTPSMDTLSTYALANFSRATAGPDTIGSLADFATPANISNYGTATSQDTSRLGPGERPMIVTWNMGLVGRNFVVPINTTDGVPFVAPYMSFRLRIMNTGIIQSGNISWIGSSDGTASGKMAYGAANRAVNTLCEMCGGNPGETMYGRNIAVTADLVGLR
jgi:hypothetical protein